MSKITLLNVPKEWKRKQNRVSCPHCKSEQWSLSGLMPEDHDRPDGRRCAKAARVEVPAIPQPILTYVPSWYLKQN